MLCSFERHLYPKSTQSSTKHRLQIFTVKNKMCTLNSHRYKHKKNLQCTKKKVWPHCAVLRSSSIFLFSSSFLALANKRWWNFYKKFWVLFLVVATSWDSLWSLLSIIIKKGWHFFQNPLRIGILLSTCNDIPKNNLGFDYIFYLIILGTITISLDQDFEPQNGTPACKESLYINSYFP